jgi:hypothetical protein
MYAHLAPQHVFDNGIGLLTEESFQQLIRLLVIFGVQEKPQQFLASFASLS